MLFNPTGLTECLQEWEDLEKDYQQVQVSLSFSSATPTAFTLNANRASNTRLVKRLNFSTCAEIWANESFATPGANDASTRVLALTLYVS